MGHRFCVFTAHFEDGLPYSIYIYRHKSIKAKKSYIFNNFLPCKFAKSVHFYMKIISRFGL